MIGIYFGHNLPKKDDHHGDAHSKYHDDDTTGIFATHDLPGRKGGNGDYKNVGQIIQDKYGGKQTLGIQHQAGNVLIVLIAGSLGILDLIVAQ